MIRSRSKVPWVPICVDGSELDEMSPGSVAMILGGTGTGKSSLAIQILAEHARDRGPALYYTMELTSSEAYARLIGIMAGVSWKDVLKGMVSDEAMLDVIPSRLAMIDRNAARDALGNGAESMRAAIVSLRSKYPGQPTMVGFDYLQSGVTGEKMRFEIGAVAEELRRVAEGMDVVMLGVSQVSRATASAIRSGELRGVDTASAGAESSTIERVAYLTLTIGKRGDRRADGGYPHELNVGKERFGEGDRIVPVIYHGSSGRWCVAGSSRPASEAERAAEDELAVAILAIVSASDRPMTKAQVRERLGKRNANVAKVVARMVAEKRLSEDGDSGGRYPRLWIPGKPIDRQGAIPIPEEKIS